MLLAKLRLLGVVAASALVAACVVENDPAPPPRGYGGAPAGAGGTGTTNGSGGANGGATNATPILVDIDTDKTMNAAPGEGVGVFVEYASGGHWHVWWTCDTNVNPQALTCDFAIRATVSQGAMSLTQSQAPDGAVRTVGTPAQEIDASTTTGAQLHGMNFDTDPGAAVTLDATIGGARDGRYFFFVQSGKVNGGYTGTLTDPLMFEGTKP